MIKRSDHVLISFFVGLLPLCAHSAPSFRFDAVHSIEAMRQFIEQSFPLNASREALRKTFVDEGKATLKAHPVRAGIEKYIYDINLCRYYVWRWNISADYDESGRLKQVYLNGDPIHKGGTPKKEGNATAPPGKKASIYMVKRPRPQADKGEGELAYLLLDPDSDSKTMDDQALIGTGPSRMDPIDMGKMISYNDVEPWRSIFDRDETAHIAPYSGDCAKVDAWYEKQSDSQGW